MDAILRAAGAALGVELFEPVDLGGSRRSVVLRCGSSSGSVIVKAFATEESEARRAFVAEVAGLSLPAAPDPAGPELLAVDPDFPLLVMADLGPAPSLADVLLGDDPDVATAALFDWARTLGRLAKTSVDRRPEFSRLWATYDPQGTLGEDDPWMAAALEALPAVLREAGVTAPGLADEMARTTPEDYPAFSPGDTCPDNTLFTQDGLRLIDFEAAGYQSVFLTAAYCRMPFSSCWCVFRLPAEVAAGIEQAFRAEVVAAYPALADDTVWQAGVRRAVAAWTVSITVHLLPDAMERERPMHRTRQPVPTGRQLLAHRWQLAATLPEFPALTHTMRQLLQVAAEWNVPPLPGYPAFT